MAGSGNSKKIAREIVAIVLNGIALFAFGLGMTGWLNPWAGVCFMGIAVVYWVWEIFTSKTVSEKLPGMLRLLAAIILVVTVAGISIPRIRARLTHLPPAGPTTVETNNSVVRPPHDDGNSTPPKVESHPQTPRVPKAAREPEVEMYFVNPKNVEWRIKNNSSSLVVQNALYWFFLINIDHPLINGNVPQPLRIPSQKVDFINADDFSGGVVLPPEIQQAVQAGDRIFGTAEVGCPGCKDKGYWLYFRQGEGGWFSRMNGYTSRGLNFPVGPILTDPDKEIETLVPLSIRVAIKNGS